MFFHLWLSLSSELKSLKIFEYSAFCWPCNYDAHESVTRMKINSRFSVTDVHDDLLIESSILTTVL